MKEAEFFSASFFVENRITTEKNYRIFPYLFLYPRNNSDIIYPCVLGNKAPFSSIILREIKVRSNHDGERAHQTKTV